MRENIIKNKSFDFALKIVKLYQFLVDQKKEHVMSRQLLKSGTSIGANVREAEHGQSKEDFIHKLSISLKEANETDYWLDLLFHSGYLEKSQYDDIKLDVDEILRLLVSIVKKSKGLG